MNILSCSSTPINLILEEVPCVSKLKKLYNKQNYNIVRLVRVWKNTKSQ